MRQEIGAGRLERLHNGLVPDLSVESGAEWRFDYLFSIGTASWIVHFCVIILGGVVLYETGSGVWVAGWAAVMAVFSLSMMMLAVAYNRRRPSSPAARYGLAHSVLTGMAGLGWGIGAVLCALTSSTGGLTFYTLVLGGTALGAVSSQHILMRSCMISVWTSIPLLIAGWLIHGAGSVPIATMMLLFGIILTVTAMRMNSFVAQNVTLANQLATKNEQLMLTGRQLAEAHEEKTRFLAQASHDLRQPIHVIGLFVAYLGETRMSRDGREVLANIERSLESLNRLCRSLLDLSALDVGRVKPAICAVALADVVGEVARQSAEAARERKIVLRYRPSRLWVRTDPALFHTMVQNLVSNAIKYAPGAQVLIGTRRKSGKLAIIVADTGPGIAEADQDRVFQEFVQIDTPGSGEVDGLGLGLSIVKRLADIMELRVRLSSREGKGTCFAIEGLVEATAGTERVRSGNDRHLWRLQGLRVLVIDDDQATRASTQQLLSGWGCEVTTCESARNDMDIPDFVLSDQELGDELSGMDVVRLIRSSAGYKVPAAIVTGGRTECIIDQCARESIVLLSKPVRPAQLRSTLLACLALQSSPHSAATPAAAERDLTSSVRNNAET